MSQFHDAVMLFRVYFIPRPLRHFEIAGGLRPCVDVLQEGHRLRSSRSRGRKNDEGESCVVSRFVRCLLNGALAAFLSFSRSQQRHDTVRRHSLYLGFIERGTCTVTGAEFQNRIIIRDHTMNLPFVARQPQPDPNHAPHTAPRPPVAKAPNRRA